MSPDLVPHGGGPIDSCPAWPARGPAPQAPRPVALVVALSLAVAVLLATARQVVPGGSVVAGAAACAVLIGASTSLRARRAAGWTSFQRDPFLAFAGSVVALSMPHLLVALDPAASPAVGRAWWVAAVAAATFAATGLLNMLRDLAPGRALDALFLAAIGALTAGVCAWLAVLRVVAVELGGRPTAAAALAPAVLDLIVLGLGLQVLQLRSRARRGCRLFLLAWTSVLVADITRLLAQVAGGAGATRPLVFTGVLTCGLLAASALHPDAAALAEPRVGPLTRLPRSQVALLSSAVVLGPAAFAVGLQGDAEAAVVLPLAGVLSLLVVAYLVRLVQGRAVLEHRAHHDELTGLANRTLFQERAALAIGHARRTGGRSAVLFLDLDRFKNVNDSLGHGVGNLLLQAVAKRLRASTRAEDTVARLGGDEFAVLLPRVDTAEQAAAAASTILEQFGEPFALNGVRLFASPSIGIALFPDDGDAADTLLENADIAMYRAKQQGRRTFCAYHRSMNDHAHERLALENQLHTAVERGEMRLVYQPKIHLSTGQMVGMEALLRWDHPELGVLQPADFIPVAEESGLIVPVGEWALEEACRQNQAWSAAGFAPLVVAVNLSLRQFQQQPIDDVVARILRTTGLDPALLELEVTESLAMQDPDQVCATLLELRNLGVQCSIDDFGTGYSGLSHLAGFAIDKLKIDKSFVATIDTHREAPIVTAVVALAHGLGLEVVAEGVETREQLDRLRELGCDEMQGFLFSHPLRPGRFEELLTDGWNGSAPDRSTPALVPRLVVAS